MAKGNPRANLRDTRTQINNAQTSAQARAFRARQVAHQKRAAEERKLRAAVAATRANAAESTAEPTPTTSSEPIERSEE